MYGDTLNTSTVMNITCNMYTNAYPARSTTAPMRAAISTRIIIDVRQNASDTAYRYSRVNTDIIPLLYRFKDVPTLCIGSLNVLNTRQCIFSVRGT